MLDKAQTAAAAKTLHDHWQAGTKLGDLEPPLRPRDRAEGYAIQAAMQAYGSLFGWKIAATSEAGQKHINVAGPLAGRIFGERVIPNGGTASMAGNDMRVGEPEFAFRMGRSLPPRPTLYSVAEVLSAVDTLHPAIELPDSASPISSRLEKRNSSPTMPARICSSSARQRPRTGARSISSSKGRWSRCAASGLSATAAMCSAIPASR